MKRSRRLVPLAAILCLPLCATASAEPHRLGVHENPMGAVVDECPEYAFTSAWLHDGRDEPFRLRRGRETYVKRRGQNDANVPEGTLAMEWEFRQGRARFTIQIESGHWWYDPADVIPQLVENVLDKLPGTLTQRLPHTYIQIVNSPGAFTASLIPERRTPVHSRTLADGSVWWWRTEPAEFFFSVRIPRTRVSQDPHDMETGRTLLLGPAVIIHELAHILDYRASLPGIGHLVRNAGVERRVGEVTSGYSDSRAWKDAITESPCAVSEYATLNAGEDFAESVLAWFLYYRYGEGARYPERLSRIKQEGDTTSGYGLCPDPPGSGVPDAFGCPTLTRADFIENRRVIRERLGKRFNVLRKFMHERFAPFPVVPPGGSPSPSD